MDDKSKAVAMRLYLVQHGEAVGKDVDPNRPLSERGEEDIRHLAGLLAERGVKVAEILHSGKTRARQTAELLETLLEPLGTLAQRDGLAPKDPPAEFLQSLADREDDVLVAGHLPFVARALALAMSGDEDCQMVEFRPGCAAGLERGDDNAWRIILFLPPLP